MACPFSFPSESSRPVRTFPKEKVEGQVEVLTVGAWLSEFGLWDPHGKRKETDSQKTDRHTDGSGV